MARSAPTSPKIGIVSLGCPKALVDSERIITRLKAEGYEIAPDYKGADAVLVNTCGFLDSARAESLDAIGEAIAKNGRVIVTGCLGAEESVIREIHPRVMAVTGPHQYESVMAAVHEAAPAPHDPLFDLVPPQGVKLTPRHHAYLKISEGCNNTCSFCIIPSMRGKLSSRRIDAVLKEAEKLVAAGVRELLVISQDTSAYGADLKYPSYEWRGNSYETRFHDLVRGLSSIGAWVRLHYVYPYPHVDNVISMMRQGAVLPYLDIPFQHASPKVLKAMRRPANQEKTLDQINRWRAIAPDLVLRSTFIVGFPGETDEDFDFLLDWMKEAKLNRVGCFKFEPVKGAAANALPGAVADEIKQERYARFMETQQAISAELLRGWVGRHVDVIIDEVDEEGAIGRSYADAPEIDGAVILEGETGLRAGDIVRAVVTGADEYDLWAARIDGGAPAGKR